MSTDNASSISLYDIERGIHEAFNVWQEAETPEAMAEAETALASYLTAEIQKVDGVRAYVRHCQAMAEESKREEQAQANRAAMWKAREDRLKAFVQMVMSAAGKKRLEGRTGLLLLKGNGGLAPLSVDMSLLPAEFQTVTVTIPAEQWERAQWMSPARAPLYEPNNGAIRAVLAADQGVPGARLEPRGSHVEIK